MATSTDAQAQLTAQSPSTLSLSSRFIILSISTIANAFNIFILPAFLLQTKAEQYILIAHIIDNPKISLLLSSFASIIVQIWVGQSIAPQSVPNKIEAVKRSILATLAASLLFHVVAILLGAPLIRKQMETLVLSLYVACLAVPPAAYLMPFTTQSDKDAYLRLFSGFRTTTNSELSVAIPFFATIIGSMSGAVALPLDWDRPWQQWPTTCAIGAFAGLAIGNFVTYAIFWLNAHAGLVEKVESKEKVQ